MVTYGDLWSRMVTYDHFMITTFTCFLLFMLHTSLAPLSLHMRPFLHSLLATDFSSLSLCFAATAQHSPARRPATGGTDRRRRPTGRSPPPSSSSSSCPGRPTKQATTSQALGIQSQKALCRHFWFTAYSGGGFAKFWSICAI